MISAIIPYMPIWPYSEKIDKAVKSLEAQTVKPEIIINEQPVEKYIKLNQLLNDGVRKAVNHNIFLCNADIEIEDPTLFQRMLDTDYDVIFCAYYSNVAKGFKPADGAGIYTDKDIISKFGYFDETLLGISRSTFQFVDWAIDNTFWHCSKDFQIKLIPDRKLKPKEREKIMNEKVSIKVHKETRLKCKQYADSAIDKFRALNLWGFN